jgi:hypothetical protein
MTTVPVKISLQNSTSLPRILWMEPLGEDFTLLPGEEVEIVFRRGRPSIVEHAESTQIYIEETDLLDYDVLLDGKVLECGHNRQAALDAGLKF